MRRLAYSAALLVLTACAPDTPAPTPKVTTEAMRTAPTLDAAIEPCAPTEDGIGGTGCETE